MLGGGGGNTQNGEGSCKIMKKRVGEAGKNLCSRECFRKKWEERERFEQLKERRKVERRAGNIHYKKLCSLTHLLRPTPNKKTFSKELHQLLGLGLQFVFGMYQLSDQDSLCLAGWRIQSSGKVRGGSETEGSSQAVCAGQHRAAAISSPSAPCPGDSRTPHRSPSLSVSLFWPQAAETKSCKLVPVIREMHHLTALEAKV